MSYLFPLLIMSITWSVGNILVKKSFARLTPWQIYAFDAVFIALPLWLIYGFLTHGNLLHTTPIAFISAFLISIVYGLYYYTINAGPIGLTSPIMASYPLITVILAFFLLNERLGIAPTLGIILTIVGIILISIPGKLKFRIEKWVFLSFLVMVGYGITGYTGKLAVNEVGNSTYIMILAVTQVMAVIIWKLFIKDKIPKFNFKSLSLPAFGITLLNIGNIAYYVALENGFVSIVAPLSNSYLILLVILSVLYLKEKITRHQLIGIFIVIIGVILINIPESSLPSITNSTNPISPTAIIFRETAKVSFVYDGDTILLDDGKKIRYIGINTPERAWQGKKSECFAESAWKMNNTLVNGRTITMEKDVSETDKYGRLLRYVWENNVFINEYLVRQGYAKLESIPPDTRYLQLLQSAEIEAKANGRGMWRECT